MTHHYTGASLSELLALYKLTDRSKSFDTQNKSFQFAKN